MEVCISGIHSPKKHRLGCMQGPGAVSTSHPHAGPSACLRAACRRARDQPVHLSDWKVMPDAECPEQPVTDCRAAGIQAVLQAMPLTSRRLGLSAVGAAPVTGPIIPKASSGEAASPERTNPTDRLQGYKMTIDEVSRALESTNNQGQLLILDVIGKVRREGRWRGQRIGHAVADMPPSQMGSAWPVCSGAIV